MATMHDKALEEARGRARRRHPHAPDPCVDVMTSVVDRIPKLNRPERESIGEPTQVYARIQPKELKAMNFYESRALEVLS